MQFKVISISGTSQVQIRLQAVMVKGSSLLGGTIDLRLTPAASSAFEHGKTYDISAVLAVQQ